ncbi:HAD family hydrolase [Patescibacteria group bacterium]
MYKDIIEGKKAVVFDLDGTIIDTKEYALEAIRKTLEGYKLTFMNPDPFYKAGGRSWKNIWKGMLSFNNIKMEKSIKEACADTHNNYLKIIKSASLKEKEGFWEFIYDLKEEKNIKIALTTNSERDITNLILDKLDMDEVFDYTICGDEVKRKKPNPEMYKKIARKLAVKRKEITVFEDSLPGAKAATKAGMDLVIIWDGKTSRDLYPGNILYFLTDFKDLGGNLDNTYLDTLFKVSKFYENIKAARK